MVFEKYESDSFEGSCEKKRGVVGQNYSPLVTPLVFKIGQN